MLNATPTTVKELSRKENLRTYFRDVSSKHGHKKIKNILILILVALSVTLTILDWSDIKDAHGFLQSMGLASATVIFTEVLFVVGAILMAISVGENFPSIKRIHKWPGHIAALRRDTRLFAEHLLTSRLFAIGFWLNFIGAVGTSALLILAILKFAPYTGLGLLLVIVIDLVGTFGWRIPLEIARRREVKQHGIH